MKYFLFIVFVFFAILSYSQDNLAIKPVDKKSIDTISYKINPLAPSKAAFYSALLPGLGQYYNKKYWKIPVVWGAIGAGVGIYIWNDNKFNEVRTAYKMRLEGVEDQFNFITDVARLETAMRGYRRQRDLVLIVTIALYVLNIIDANVDAHLQQFNVNDKLTISPQVYQNPLNQNINMGMQLSFKFN